MENIFLGREIRLVDGTCLLDRKTMLEKATALLRDLELNIDPKDRTGALGIGHQQMVEINFYGALAGLHAAFPYLRDTPRAQVVNMCSASAIYGQPELATYSATKFALRAMTEALELEWRGHGIRVLAMWPLFVQTAMIAGVETGSTKSLGVHLTPEDVAEAVYSATHRSRSRLPKVHYPVGRTTSMFAAVSQVTPTWVQRLLTKTLTRS